MPYFSRAPSLTRARGIALPVVLIILTVMLLGSVYLLKSVRSTEISTTNLAYDATLTRAADRGLYTAYQWLSNQATTSKAALDQTIFGASFYSPQRPALSVTPRDPAYWANALPPVTGDDGTTFQYVIYRLCLFPGAYNAGSNSCVQSAAASSSTGVTTGTSMKVGPVYNTVPQVHYVITSRIIGLRGATVINQMIVLI